jgi:hypothetical protein
MGFRPGARICGNPPVLRFRGVLGGQVPAPTRILVSLPKPDRLALPKLGNPYSGFTGPRLLPFTFLE